MNKSSKLEAILTLPSFPETILYRPYLEKVNSGTLLDWFLDKFLSEKFSFKLHVLVSPTNESDYSAIDKAAKLRKVNVLKVEQYTQFQALVSASKHIKAPVVAVIPLGFNFAPNDLLERTVSHHLEQNNDFTYVTGFPEGTAPEIYRAEIFQLLSKINFPFTPTTTREALQYISSLNNDPNNLHQPSALLNALLRILRLLAKRGIASFKSVPFEALATYEAEKKKAA
jgi:spore coat polysaccharide biosynthesis protein SpsF (cytidylyltransferase family)